MPTKILVVDDSATMRKILEMTFAGEDAEVVTVEDGQAAVAKAGQMVPDVVFADVSMPGMDAYAVSHSIKSNPALGKTAVIALASQHNPYDESKGQGAGVDAHVNKPFDTQALIDMTAQVLRAPRAVAEGAAPVAAPAMPRAATQTVTNVAPPPPPGGAPRPAAAPAAPAPDRNLRRTAAFGEPPPLRPPAQKPVLELADEPEIEVEAPEAPAARPAAPSAGAMPRATVTSTPAAPSAKPAAPQATRPAFPAAAPAAPAAAKPDAAPAAPAPAPASAAVAAASAGLEQKLAGLGLTADQVQGVLALSREVVEQVVWEVVPELAEALIKEEIARLTRE